MAPLVKDKTEATTTGLESAASAALPQGRGADHLSAEAVSLEVPVNIHGSRVIEAGRGAPQQTEPFEEQTTTMIVFPQGGVLRMSTPVTVGQMLVVTNLKSRQDAICRVVKVRTYSSVASYVEVEFTHARAGYWGVFFSSEGPELSQKATGNFSLESPELAPEQKSPSAAPLPVSVPPVAPATRPVSSAGPTKDEAVYPSSRQVKDSGAPSTLGVASNRNESSFISIGSQEEVQLSATSTTFKVAPAGTFESQRGTSAPRKDQPAPSQQARALQETQEATENHLSDGGKSTPAAEQNSSGSFGDAFGGTLLQSKSREVQHGSDSGVSAPGGNASQNWKLIVGGVTLGIVLAGAGFFLFRPSAKGSGAVKPSPAAAELQSAPVPQSSEPAANPSVPAQAIAAHSGSGPASTGAQAAPKNNLIADAKRPEPAAAVAKTPKSEETTEVEPARTPPAAKRNVPDVTSDLFGALNAHPVSGRAADGGQPDAAPVVSAPAPAPLNANSSPVTLPPPSAVSIPVPTQTVPGAPLQAGGAVPQPRLITSTLPTYPAAAKQTRTEGAVTLRTTVDERGNVSDAQVVSGPTLLREPAIDAVKHWKYEPSHVNGKPVAVQILVTIHFRL